MFWEENQLVRTRICCGTGWDYHGFARAMPGGDENQGKCMGKYLFEKDRIRAATGAHVMSVHHCGKNEDNWARGHSSLRAAMDTEIRVTRPSDGFVSLVTVTKHRDLPAIDPMAFSLETVELGANRRGNAITSCLVNLEGGYPKLTVQKPSAPPRTFCPSCRSIRSSIGRKRQKKNSALKEVSSSCKRKHWNRTSPSGWTL